MPLETGNFILDLDENNPPGGDLKSQGDNHIRLVKHVLRSSFPGGSKSFYFPKTISVSGNYNVAAADQNAVIVMNTSTTIPVISLPTLTAADEGWRVSIVKTFTSGSGLNPLFVNRVGGGSLFSGQYFVGAARRCIPYQKFDAIWAGGNFWVERIERLPVGSVIPFTGANLPVGYEWPNGVALNTSLYPEYATAIGSGAVMDLREKVIAGSGLGGASIGLISPSRSGITPVLGAFGGTDGVQLTAEQLASHTHGLASSWDQAGSLVIGNESANHSHSGSTGATDIAHTHAAPTLATAGFNVAGGGTTLVQGYTGGPSSTQTGGMSTPSDHTHSVNVGTQSANHVHSISGATQGAGSNQFHQNMPPTLICNYILVVE